MATALYLGSSFATQAVIFGDADLMKEGRGKSPNGVYPLIRSMEGKSANFKRGTAVYFETEDGKLFGLTNAHTLDFERNEKVGVLLGKEKSTEDDKSSNFYICPFNTFQKQPSYGYDLLPISELPINKSPEKGKVYVGKSNEKLRVIISASSGERVDDILDILISEDLTPEALKKFAPQILQEISNKGLTQSWEESVAQDIGIFSIKKKDSVELPHKFKGALYEGPLNDGEVYSVVVTSCGPIFDNQLTSYEEYTSHEAPARITYNAGGFFTQTVDSKDFYLLISQAENKLPEWYFDALPNKGMISTGRGDSGSLVKTEDGQALALSTGISWENFYKDNEELAQHLSKIKKETITENLEITLLDKIHADIADEGQTKRLSLENGSILYRFTLNEKYAPLKVVNYFTPLTTHKEFIEAFINQHKCQPQSNLARSELYQKLKPLKKSIEKFYAQALIANYELSRIEKTKENLPLLEKYLATCKTHTSVLTTLEQNEEILSWWSAHKDDLKGVDFQPSFEEAGIIERLISLEKLINLSLSIID
ncbi:MAG: hypothetical protein H0X26_06860 [Alphaproteobacteria bacterium]|nr:hypothetical protein [Alphaproteobacteria bacterium]